MKENQIANTLYRYRLTEGYPTEPASIEGITFTRNWKVVEDEIQTVKPYLKTPLNKNGILDQEIFRGDTGQVLKSTILNVKKHMPYLTREVLDIMPRPQLAEIALYYEIDPVRKVNSFLVIKILEAQQKRKELEKKEEPIASPSPAPVQEDIQPILPNLFK